VTDSTVPTLSARQRLERARAEAADLAAQQLAAETTPTPAAVTLPQVGDIVTVLVPVGVDRGDHFAETDVLARGDRFKITAGALDRARNRLGDWCGIALAADPAAQLKAWGEQRFIIGDLPDGFETWTRPGSAEWGRDRARAIDDAYALRGDERAAALAEVNRRFGPPPSAENPTKYRGDSGDWPDAR